MATYKVTETDTGREVKSGDTVTDFRGDQGVFLQVTRGVEYNGTAKVLVQPVGVSYNQENYERVWGLTVETLSR